MQLLDIKVFLHILSTGSFTAAARALRMPKSSVARQLSRLEEDLGCRLIERTTRTLQLTDEGRTFLPHARRLLDDSIEAARVVGSGEAGASGQLTVSAPGTFGRAFLAGLLPAFRARYSNVRVALHLGAKKVRIGVGEADIAIRLGPLVEANLGARRLGQIDFCLVASPGYMAGRPVPQDPLDLAQLDLVELRPPASDNRLDLVRDGRTQPVRCVPGIEMDDPEAAKLVALAHGGVAVLPRFLVAEEIRRGLLLPVLDGWAPVPAPVNVVFDARMAPRCAAAPMSISSSRRSARISRGVGRRRYIIFIRRLSPTLGAGPATEAPPRPGHARGGAPSRQRAAARPEDRLDRARGKCGEQRQHLGPRGGVEPGEALRPGIETLGLGPLGEDDLAPVEEKVDEADPLPVPP